MRSSRDNHAVAVTREEFDSAQVAPRRRRCHLRGRVAIVAVFTAAAGFLTAGPATAQEAAPGWMLTTTNYPSVLTPAGHGTVEVALYNVGAATSHGQVTVTDKLPLGITATGEAGALVGTDNDEPEIESGLWHCKGNGGLPGEELVQGATEVTCTNDPTRLPSFPGGGGVPTRDTTLNTETILPVIGIPVTAPATEQGVGINEVSVSGGEGGNASATAPIAVGSPSPSFSFTGWDTWFSKADGTLDTAAGSHPYEWTTRLDLATLLRNDGATKSLTSAGGEPRDFIVKLPAGLIGNPWAVTQCTRFEFSKETGPESCPPSSIVGVATAYFTGFKPAQLSVFNMVPPPGGPAELAFSINGVASFIHPALRTGSDYGLDAHVDNVAQRAIMGAILTIWGVPADPSHDRWRGDNGFACTAEEVAKQECVGELPEPRQRKPFLTLPTSCSGPPSLPIAANTWGSPIFEAADDVQFHDADGNPTGFTGCNQLPFAPTISSKPTTNVADAPSGLEFDLHFPQTGLEDPEAEVSEAHLKQAVVTLPKGVAVNPASAHGLAACTSAQIGLTSPIGATPITTTPGPATCPDAAKIGSVEVDTPLLDHPVKGGVYVAAPQENPFGSLLAIYIAVNDPATGTVIKLAGQVEADPVTGQLKATFTNNPQLPFEDFHLNFFGGAHAALRTPSICGRYETTTDMTPWSAPEGADATPADSFETTQGANNGPCAASEAQLPNAPAFSAGTITPKAGIYSPFVLHLAREDGSQEIKGIDTTLPAGLIGKLAGISECSDAQLAAAATRTKLGDGALELSSPSCPLNSEVGTVNVGAGAGPDPYYVQGHAYLAGPYKGASLSLAIVTPAVAGPYDLGTVVVRTALYVNPETAQIHAVSDPIPTILQGIPLDARSISLDMNRPNFTLNPTSCAEKTVLGSATSVLGQVASLSQRFQVGECSKLGFKPKLSLSLKGGTKRNAHPPLKTALTYPKGSYANIARAVVTLPATEFIDNNHIQNPCTRVQFAANECPAKSILGHARAFSPLLDQPLEGPVYFRSNGGEHLLPDVVADLKGQIHIVLVGNVDSVHKKGSEESRIRTTFATVPDAPVSKFALSLFGGKRGLLVNSTNICKVPNKAVVKLTAQNGKTYDTNPAVANSCKVKAKKHHKHHHRGKR